MEHFYRSCTIPVREWPAAAEPTQLPSVQYPGRPGGPDTAVGRRRDARRPGRSWRLRWSFARRDLHQPDPKFQEIPWDTPWQPKIA